MAIALLILSGLVVLAWPFLAFGSVFVFDEPSRGFAFEVARHIVFFGVLSYSAGYLYAVWKREPGKKFGQDARTLLLLASPVLQLGLVYAIAKIFA